MNTLSRLAGVLVASALVFAQDDPAPEKPSVPEKPAPTPNPVMVIKTSMGDVHVEMFAEEAPKTVENFIGLATGAKEWTDPKTREKKKTPYYDGLIFHRVIKGFMIQGGCPLGTGSGSPGFKFEDEINAKALGLDKLKAVDDKGQPHPWLLIRSQSDFQRTVLGPLVSKMGVKSQAEFQQRAEEINKKLKEAVPKLTLKNVYENLGYQYNDKRNSHKPKKGCLAMANSGPNTNGSQFFINLDDTPHLTGKHTVFGKVVKGMDIVESIGEVKVGQGARPVEELKIVSIRPLVNEATPPEKESE